jgi:hypothetical protein
MQFKSFVIGIIVFSVFGCSETNGTSHADSSTFEIAIINTDVNHPVADTLIEIIELDCGAPDLFLTHKLYDVPSDLPKSFSSTTDRDALITTIYHPNDTNYKFKRVIGYDTAWRVNQYSLYPSVISSTGGYNYYVYYNELGQVSEIKDSFVQVLSRGYRYEFDYLENGNLKEIREFGNYSRGRKPSRTIQIKSKS